MKSLERQVTKTMIYICVDTKKRRIDDYRSFRVTYTMTDCIIENKHLVYFVFVIMNNALYMIQSTDLLLPLFSFYHVLGPSH